MLKLLDDETAVSRFVVYAVNICFLDARVCLSWCVVFCLVLRDLKSAM
jgi:hypothetical protein